MAEKSNRALESVKIGLIVLYGLAIVGCLVITILLIIGLVGGPEAQTVKISTSAGQTLKPLKPFKDDPKAKDDPKNKDEPKMTKQMIIVSIIVFLIATIALIIGLVGIIKENKIIVIIIAIISVIILIYQIVKGDWRESLANVIISVLTCIYAYLLIQKEKTNTEV